MSPLRLLSPLLALCLTAAVSYRAHGQAPGVPVTDDAMVQKEVTKKAEALATTGKLTKVDDLKKQLDRTSCALALPPAGTDRLRPGEVWERAQAGAMAVGVVYLCPKCDHWHTNLAGGYAVTADGAVATCHHVMEPTVEMREGYFIAVDSAGEVHAVTEVLAANPRADVCLVKTTATSLKPLPLNENVRPGDDAFCLSSPQGRHDFFTRGSVVRFYYRQNPPKPGLREWAKPVFMALTTDWAAGSSGSAILDRNGNAIGHVVATQPVFWRGEKKADDLQMVIKEAVAAREVRALITPPAAPAAPAAAEAPPPPAAEPVQ